MFIRTKDTIYEVVSETELIYVVKAKRNPNHLYSKSKINTVVIDKADTIEELCDQCVIQWQDGAFTTWSLSKENNRKMIDRLSIYSNYQIKHRMLNVYGSIWIQTSTGAWRLEPVAKLNKETEKVELI